MKKYNKVNSTGWTITNKIEHSHRMVDYCYMQDYHQLLLRPAFFENLDYKPSRPYISTLRLNFLRAFSVLFLRCNLFSGRYLYIIIDL